jgi:C-terminal processing protease CtpA/Prc
MLDGDETLADAAEQALSQIARQQNTWSAQRADLALEQTRLLKQHKSLDKVKALGAEVVDESVDENGELSYLTLIIKQENWKGTDKDLRLLRSLPSLRSLSVFGPVFSETQLTTLGELKELVSLNLYATKLSNDGLARLQTAMPYTRIDRRNGGMLGISGDQIGGNGCIVNTVQPDSAAAAAGIEPEDIVLSIDGKEVDSFSELTKHISEKSGGDVVKLKIKRGGQTLDKEAKLGDWKPEHVKNGFRAGGNVIILQNGQRIIAK